MVAVQLVGRDRQRAAPSRQRIRLRHQEAMNRSFHRRHHQGRVTLPRPLLPSVPRFRQCVNLLSAGKAPVFRVELGQSAVFAGEAN